MKFHMEKVNLIQANTLIKRGEPIDDTYVSWHPIHIIRRGEGFQYMLVLHNWRLTYHEKIKH